MTTFDNVLSFVQLSPLIDSVDLQEIGSESNWTTPLVSYLKNGILPDGTEAVRKLKVQAARFILMKDVLYKRGFSRPYLRCLGPEEAGYVMREVYEGIYENHSGSQSLAHKLIRAGYYWPTMQKDAQTYVKACENAKDSATSFAVREVNPYDSPIAVHSVGVKHHGAVPNSGATAEVPDSRHQLLHEMGGS